MSGPTFDTEVPAFWRGLGLPGLADTHVHFLPPRMLRWEQSGNLRPVGPSRPSIYRWSDEERVRHLQTMGVRAFTAMAYAHQPDLAAHLNAWTLDFAARTPGCVPSATFYPEPGVNRYTRAAIDAGARIFKVHLQAGYFSPAHARLDAVWGVLAEAQIPVIMHPGADPAGGVHIDPLAAVLRRHPRLTAVVAHLGAPDYIECLELADKHENVCLETSLAFTRFLDLAAPFPRAYLPQLLDLGLGGKVLLGTVFPNLPHPYAEQVSALVELDLGDDWLAAVRWHNAAHLLRLS